MNRPVLTLFAATTSALALSVACAQEETSGIDGEERVETITVKGQALDRNETGFSASTISAADIQLKRVSEINELLEDVPGMSVTDFGLGGVASATVIRGFGSGAHGGDLGVVIDGIPLNEANSHADGYVDLNVIVPLEISGLTVYRGPVSALYGNFNRGGLIALETRKDGNYTQSDVSAGSDTTADAQFALGRTVGDNQQYNAAMQLYHTDGFRPQSEADRITLSSRAGFQVTLDLDFSISGRFHDTEAESAAYLTFDQFEDDPYGIDQRTQNDGAEKTFSTLRADAGYRLGPDTTLLTYLYTTQQDFTRWFSRGSADAPSWRQREEGYDREVYGAGTSLNGRITLGGKRVNYVAGVETFDETTDYIFFDDLDNRQRIDPAQFDRQSTLTSVSAFGEADIALAERLSLSLGVRADRFSGDCRLNGPETGNSPCGDFDDASHVSPKIGVQSQLTDWIQLRASYSEGFALASGFAKFAVGAQGLDENELRQTEIGARLTPTDMLEADVAVYRIESTNEITEVSPGEYQNFGETLRRGVETSVTWRPISQLSLRGVHSYTDSQIEENINAAIVGNEVTSVPDHTATLTATYLPTQAITLGATGRYVGPYWADAQNTLQADDYTLLDLDASYRLNKDVPVKLYAGIDNVTDEVYTTAVFGIGVAPGRPRIFRVGLQLGL